jgi:hypothetical protein
LEVVSTHHFNKVDLILVTDGEDSLKNDFLEEFAETKRDQCSSWWSKRRNGSAVLDEVIEPLRSWRQAKKYLQFNWGIFSPVFVVGMWSLNSQKMPKY